MIAIAGLEGALIGTCIVDGVQVCSYDSGKALDIFKRRLDSYVNAVALLEEFVASRGLGGPLFVDTSQYNTTGAGEGATVH
jgi:hypothetical protein